jgi:hypothetical protein
MHPVVAYVRLHHESNGATTDEILAASNSVGCIHHGKALYILGSTTYKNMTQSDPIDSYNMYSARLMA